MRLAAISSAANVRRARYAWHAWLLAAIPALLYFFARVAVGADSLRPPPGALYPAFAGYSILGAPLLETALMLPLASLYALISPRHERVQILLLALTCALAHKIGGNWQQAFASLWPFVVYSRTLIVWRRQSRIDAYVLTAVVHALYNATFIVVGALGSLAAPGGG